jgi:hypothetical protein
MIVQQSTARQSLFSATQSELFEAMTWSFPCDNHDVPSQPRRSARPRILARACFAIPLRSNQIHIELFLIVIAGLFFYLLPSVIAWICFILIYRRLGELEKKINEFSGKTAAGLNYDDWKMGFKPDEPEESPSS